MAVTTEREYGLFINGELVEPQSGEVRELNEPASGQSLARVATTAPLGKTPPTAAARGALARTSASTHRRSGRSAAGRTRSAARCSSTR